MLAGSAGHLRPADDMLSRIDRPKLLMGFASGTRLIGTIRLC